MSIRSVNPVNGKTLKTFEPFSDEAIKAAIREVHRAFTSWKKNGLDVKAKLLQRLAVELDENKRTYARIITLEMGKPIRESTAEIEKCATLCRYYSEHGPRFLADQPLNVPRGEAYIHHNPLGPVLAVMPWNFPFWQVFRFAVPATLAGNTALLKHASNVPQCASAIQIAFEAAGFPKGVFIHLLVGSDKVPLILDDPLVKAATLTGSEAAGSAVAQKAGENLKKTVLELGGSDPYIVLRDAKLEEAAETGAKARMINTGQSCIAAKRFIVEKEVFKPFLELFKQHLKSLRFGDPMDETTDYGPLARTDLAEEIHEQVKKSLDMGAKLLFGTVPETVNTAFYPPLILGNVKPGMPAFDEEIFGPVATFFQAEDVAEAIAIANGSEFGLGGSVWTQDMVRARQLAHELESGAVYINQLMFSDPHVPFGGIKKSGYGRELSHLGIREFTNQKTVWIKE